MTTLHELLKRASWPAVESALRTHYPDYRPPRFREVFDHLRALSPGVSTMRIQLRIEEPEEPDEKTFVKVSGRNQEWQSEGLASPSESSDEDQAGRECLFDLTLVSWNEWLGMGIDQESAQGHSDAEVLAHCLWEMTFFGFDEVSIAAKRASLARE